MDFLKDYGPLSDAELEEMNYLLKGSASLDNAYVVFMRNYNGGVPVNKYFLASSGEWYLDMFFHLAEVDHLKDRVHHDLNLAVNYVITSRFLGELIAIAGLPNGDFLCLDSSTKPQRVVIWHHEFEPQIDFVANNFTDFLDMLSETSEKDQ